MKAYGGMEALMHSFFILMLDARGKNPATRCKGGCVSPREILNFLKRRKTLVFLSGIGKQFLGRPAHSLPSVLCMLSQTETSKTVNISIGHLDDSDKLGSPLSLSPSLCVCIYIYKHIYISLFTAFITTFKFLRVC
jgi:hypothetical protein